MPNPGCDSASCSSPDDQEGSSCGSTYSNESSPCGSTRSGSNESSSCVESGSCDSDDGTDGGGSTCLPPEQWALSDESAEDGEWVVIPEAGSAGFLPGFSEKRKSLRQLFLPGCK